MSFSREKAFSLLELMCSVAVLGVLTMIAVPVYSGYMNDIRANVVKDQLRAIRMQEQEYRSMYGKYYIPAGACADDQKTKINTDLFAGEKALTEPRAKFCITGVAAESYTAKAEYNTGKETLTFTVDQTGAANF